MNCLLVALKWRYKTLLAFLSKEEVLRKYSYLHETIMYLWLKSLGGQYYGGYISYKSYQSYKKLNIIVGLSQRLFWKLTISE